MLKKTLIASATAGLIALGALAGSADSANAGHRHGHGPGPGYHQGKPAAHWTFHRHRVNRFCRPVIKRVMWRDRWGRPHWTKARVGFRCPHRFHHRRGWGWRGNGFSFQFGW